MNKRLTGRKDGQKRRFLPILVMSLAGGVLAGCATTAPMGRMTTASIDSTPDSTSESMPLGTRSAPPTGYLDLCARDPGTCGLQAQAGEETRKELYSRYYWGAVFGAPTAALTEPQPMMAESAIDHGVDASAMAAPAEEVIPAERYTLTWAGKTLPRPEVEVPPPPEEPQEEPAQIRLDSQAMAELNRVNRQINKAIRQESDVADYGVSDYWTLPLEAGSKVGDCEDYVLEKRRALIADGVPAAALSIAVVNTRQGEAHAVLLVTTDKGELVLDSLSPWIVNWKKAPYSWVERQAPGQSLEWVSIG